MNLKLLRKSLLFSFLFLGVLARSSAQDEFYHPELEWRTIETAHFFVHYHDGAERTARVVAKIAEDVFDPITSLYNHKPDEKVSFIIKDCDDISNGGAYFFENKVEILAPNLDFELRGTHNWLRDVVSHEFTHIVQIQTSMKFGRRVPSIYLQWLNYESERRPDVLYGYPNVVASYPISGFVVPAWFAEGVAQYNRKDFRYDFWDSHRDMILRSYALNGNMLTWEQMGVFGKTSLGNESSYNAGFAFVSYIAKTYGEDKLNEISRNLSEFGTLTIDAAIKEALGKDGAAVYNEWKEGLTAEYARRVAPIKATLCEGAPFIPEDEHTLVDAGERQGNTSFMHPRNLPEGAHMEPCCMSVAGSGFWNLYPVYSPDGKRVAYVSTKTSDYYSLASLYMYDMETGKDRLLQAGVRTALCWSPDGTSVYYARATRKNPHWSYQFDLYRYDIAADEETRITYGKRATAPSVSPDGKRIAFVVNGDGTTNLAVAAIDGSNMKLVTSFSNGEQVYTPQWSPKGDRILFDYSIRDGRDIAWVRPDGNDLQFLVEGADDSRCGTFTPDGSQILFSSDRSGIYNLYSYDVASGNVKQVTNVLGGALFPTTSSTGDIVYSAYTSAGFKLVRLQHGTAIAAAPGAYLPEDATTGVRQTTAQFDWEKLRAYDDTQLSPLDAHPYKAKFSSLMVVPFLRVDNYNTSSHGMDMLKPGVYLFSNDLLDKTGFFAGAAMNRRMERDLFLQFFYRGRLPLFYSLGLEPATSLEAYNVTRKTDTYVTLTDRAPFKLGVTYNLTEFDLALTQPVISQYANAEFRYAHSRYSSDLDGFTNSATGQWISGSSELYLVANTLTLTFNIDAIMPSSTSEINPIGRKVTLKVGRELNKFAASDSAGYRKYEISSTGLVPVYDRINLTRLELEWREHLPLWISGHTLTATLHGGTILESPVDDFFDFYLGGLVGMKGYPFYGLSGNSLASANLTYRFPLVPNIDVRLGHVYFDKLYASFYGDFGDAWTASKPKIGEFKKDAGMEVRLQAYSFYSYPTCVFFNASYGFDQFSRYIKTQNATVTYGKEWRFYFGILFGFDYE